LVVRLAQERIFAMNVNLVTVLFRIQIRIPINAFPVTRLFLLNKTVQLVHMFLPRNPSPVTPVLLATASLTAIAGFSIARLVVTSAQVRQFVLRVKQEIILQVPKLVFPAATIV
jgi:hypothetical protein